MFSDDALRLRNLMGDLSQQQVARFAQMSQGQVSNWLSGKTPISEKVWLNLLASIKKINKKEASALLSKWKIEDALHRIQEVKGDKEQYSLAEGGEIVYGLSSVKVPFVTLSKGDLLKALLTSPLRPPYAPLPYNADFFILKITAPALVGAGLQLDDEILLKHTSSAKSGDICLFSVKDEWIIGYYYPEKDCFEIKKAHKDYPPFSKKNSSVKILGVARSVWRNLCAL